jgi:hypothetical protein
LDNCSSMESASYILQLPGLINLWIPGPVPVRDLELEKQQREYLAAWGPPVPPEAGDAVLMDPPIWTALTIVSNAKQAPLNYGC